MKGMSPKRPEAEGLAGPAGVGTPSGMEVASWSSVWMGVVGMGLKEGRLASVSVSGEGAFKNGASV
jgi:hypothetical protein